MKEYPILFTGPNVRAILEGRKTQTRRIVKPQPALSRIVACDEPGVFGDEDGDVQFRCPYGQPGDQLYVRENGWQRPERTPKMMRDGADTWAPYYYDADGDSTDEGDIEFFKRNGFKRRPSIHMPRKFSRLTLEVTGVRVERLQEISTEDAIAEGVTFDLSKRPNVSRPPFRELWDKTNAKRAPWASNPWVWVIEFKRPAICPQ